MIDTYLSDKLKAISFFAMVLVVFIHGTTMMFNFGSGVAVEKDSFNLFVQSFVSDGLARIAVPSFFAISGFFFFQGKKITTSFFTDKIKKRFHSLFIPYISWSILSLLFYWLLQQIPYSKPFFITRLVANFSFEQLVHVIFLDPLAYQLWFIRDLMVLVCLSPFIYLAIRYTKWLLLLIAIVMWVSNMYLYVFQNMSFCFFVLGASIALLPFSFPKIAPKLSIILGVLWLMLCATRTYLLVCLNMGIYYHYLNLMQSFTIVIGMLAVWLGYDVLMKHKKITQWWMMIFSYTFFVYAFHEPMLTILRKASFYFSNKSVFSLFVLYWLCPILSVVIAIIVAKTLQKLMPRFYTIIIGGR